MTINKLKMQEIVRKFIEGNTEIYITDVGTDIQKNRLFHAEIQRQVKDRELKYYYYLITFTLKPEIKTDIEKIKIKKFILEQCRRPALHIVEAEYVEELTANGVEHWHIAVKSKKFIAKNRFNYYEKNYGHVDISKSTINSMSESLNYINKVTKSTKLI